MFTRKWIALSIGAVVAIVVATAVISWSINLDRPTSAVETPLQTAPLAEGSGDALASRAGEGGTTSVSGRDAADPQTAVSTDRWVLIALVAMALALTISSAISFYLYRWRKILLSNPHMLVPEQLGEWMNILATDFGRLAQTIASSTKSVERQGKETSQGVSDLTETFMTLQHALDQREREIQRLKRGYDNEIFRKFVRRFIRVDQAVEDFQRAGSADRSGLDQIRRLLGDAFAECNVECFQPEMGSDYLAAFGVADNPGKVEAERSEDDFKIAEILESGYLIRNGEDSEVIIPAKVRIYEYQSGE